MFPYTRAAIDKILAELKRILFVFSIIANLATITYLIYAIFAPAGNLIANIILLVAAVAYFVFYIVTYGNDEKRLKSMVKHAHTWFKMAVKAVTLGISVYALYTAAVHPTPISLISTVFVALMLVLSLVFEVIVLYIEDKVAFIQEAWSSDIENVMKPINTVGNAIKRVTGQEIAAPKEPSRHKKLLNNLVFAKREEKKREQDEKRQRHREAVKAHLKELGNRFKIQKKVKEEPSQLPAPTEKETAEK